jgi:DNA mismatch repair protein MutS2
MNSLLKKALQDLEFDKICYQISVRCNTDKGKEVALEIEISNDFNIVEESLTKISEYLSSFENDNVIPNHGFDSIDNELRLLSIENTAIEPLGFKKAASIIDQVRIHQKFFKKFKEYYPTLNTQTEPIEDLSFLKKDIDLIVDRFGEIKNSASPALSDLRRQMTEVRSKINQSFGTALTSALANDFLDDIKESFIDNRRVLAVKAMYRKKVKGSLMGSSKTGSIVYIVPESTQRYVRELADLEYEETEEIRRILIGLTDQLRPYKTNLNQFQNYLVNIDLIAAKAKFARDINGIKPKLNNDRQLNLKDAFHPLLYLQNQLEKKDTFPQSIELHPENRIVVISGPNAGGKSITLKTVGLLQLMIQSGILIPVHRKSTVCIFNRFLTDIGDNQSIENHLSTYSYRLKNMNQFLKKCNDSTLFLIDEFGTGSDPELGGALAETFLETFYEKESYGVITTHYSNLKLLANELEYASNANMLFDNRTLEPTYKLVLGEAGSSFTFEVAQKNGIPYSLINRAKKKIERGKIRFDATIAKLQKERSKITKTEDRLSKEAEKASVESEKMERLNTKLDEKLKSYQKLYEYHSKMIQLGEKVDELSERYFQDQKKRNLVSGFLRLVETENSKRKKKSAPVVKKERIEKKVLKSEIKEAVETVKIKEATTKKKIPKKALPKPVDLKVGDRVRLEDSRSTGTIDQIEKGIATVNYGMFTTKVALEKLNKV